MVIRVEQCLLFSPVMSYCIATLLHSPRLWSTPAAGCFVIVASKMEILTQFPVHVLDRVISRCFTKARFQRDSTGGVEVLFLVPRTCPITSKQQPKYRQGRHDERSSTTANSVASMPILCCCSLVPAMQDS